MDDIKKTYIRQYGPEVFGELDNYFPRLVDDLDTLKKALNPKNPKHMGSSLSKTKALGPFGVVGSHAGAFVK